MSTLTQKVKGLAIKRNEVKCEIKQESHKAQDHQVVQVFYHISPLQKNEQEGRSGRYDEMCTNRFRYTLPKSSIHWVWIKQTAKQQ
jgi:hypothetical protein